MASLFAAIGKGCYEFSNIGFKSVSERRENSIDFITMMVMTEQGEGIITSCSPYTNEQRIPINTYKYMVPEQVPCFKMIQMTLGISDSQSVGS
jgi:hypothetical protein